MTALQTKISASEQDIIKVKWHAERNKRGEKLFWWLQSMQTMAVGEDNHKKRAKSHQKNVFDSKVSLPDRLMTIAF